MPQVLKEEVRQRILAAALEEFAAQGFADATMAAIAARAGLGAASLYRYYPGKTELFEAILPTTLVEQFEKLLARRVRALGASALTHQGGTDEEMLRFWLDHRMAVVILLDRAAGTPHAHFADRFVDQMVTLTLEQLRASHPQLRPNPPERFVLRGIFKNTRAMLASILEQHGAEPALRQAIEAFWSYQLAGLRGFSAHLTRPR